MLDQVIVKYMDLSAEKHRFLWDIFLNGSVMPFANKLRVCGVIADKINLKFNANPFHMLSNFRNGFAHNRLNSDPLIVASRNDEDSDVGHYTFTIVSGSGKATRYKREEALEEFEKHYNECMETLVKLLKTLSLRD